MIWLSALGAFAGIGILTLAGIVLRRCEVTDPAEIRDAAIRAYSDVED